MSALSSFASFYQGGGPFMHAILATGLLILAISLERFWVIGRALAWNSAKFSRDLTDRVNRGDWRGAADLAHKVGSPAGRVAYAILSTGTRDETTLYNAADGEAQIVLAPYSKRLSHIGLLANVATLLGLLGTIFGLMTAFSAVGAADASQRSAFLAAGISEALNTTAFGLLMAVPALLVQGFFVARVEGIAGQIDEITVRVVRALSHPAPASTASEGQMARPHAAAPGLPAQPAARKPAATR